MEQKTAERNRIRGAAIAGELLIGSFAHVNWHREKSLLPGGVITLTEGLRWIFVLNSRTVRLDLSSEPKNKQLMCFSKNK